MRTGYASLPAAKPLWLAGYDQGMNLEDRSVEQAADRCEECGVRLTPAEIQAVLESRGPALCAVHVADVEPGLAVDEAAFTQE